MIISDLKKNDQNWILEASKLLKDGFKHAWTTDLEAKEEIENLLSDMHICKVALSEENKVVGLIGGNVHYDGNTWEMHPLVVKKEYHGQGVGSQLVLAFEERVREKGAMTVFLGTDDEDGLTSLSEVNLYDGLEGHIKSIKNYGRHPYEFYQKCGYQIVGVIPDANGIGKPDIFMAKRVVK